MDCLSYTELDSYQKTTDVRSHDSKIRSRFVEIKL
jgi:hypothetical protein